MRFLDEYRDARLARALAQRIAAKIRRPWTLMEVCGGQTHAIVKFGIDELLPKELTLLHGPGCPVCVTPSELIDKAILIASRRGIIFCSFGDMLRVPGSQTDLLSVKAQGGDVRIVYSPLDALRIAEENPAREVVFFAVGFETTAPANAMAVVHAKRKGIRNFSLLVSQVRVPPALETLLSSPGCQIDGFLAAGHVCTVMGWEEYEPISARYRIPIVVTGFEPVDILEGCLMVVRQLEEGRSEVENQYSRSVRREGNPHARRMLEEVFEIVPKRWRGIGDLPESGLGLRRDFQEFDAEQKFEVEEIQVQEAPDCISGLVLMGRKNPLDCGAFGTRCTPEHPLGATMVSAEGACAAYYDYKRRKPVPRPVSDR